MNEAWRTLDPDRDMWLLIARVRQTMLEARRKALAPYNITPQQSHVLRIIHDLGNKATIKQIKKKYYRQLNSMHVQIGKMADKGLLEKTKNNSGTNIVEVRITDKGLEALGQALNTSTIYDIISVLSPEEVQQLNLIMNKLLNISTKVSESFD